MKNRFIKPLVKTLRDALRAPQGERLGTRLIGALSFIGCKIFTPAHPECFPVGEMYRGRRVFASGLTLTLLCSIAHTAFGTEDYGKKTLTELIDIHNSTDNPFPQVIEELIANKAAQGLISDFDKRIDEQNFWLLREEEVKYHKDLDKKDGCVDLDGLDSPSPVRILPKPAFISGEILSFPDPTYCLSYSGGMFARCTPNKIEVYSANDTDKSRYSHEFKEKVDARALKGNGFAIFGHDGTIVSVQGKVIRTYNYSDNNKIPQQKICTETPLYVSYDSTKEIITTLLANGAIETWDLEHNVTTSDLKKFSMPTLVTTNTSDAAPVCNKHKLHIAATLNNTALIYELKNQQVLANGHVKENYRITVDGQINSLVYSDDGALFAVGTTDTVYIYNANNYTLKSTLKVTKLNESTNPAKIKNITISTDNRMIAIIKCLYFRDSEILGQNDSHLFDLTTNTEILGSLFPNVSTSNVHPVFSGNSQHCISPSGLNGGFKVNQVQAPLSVTQYALVKAIALNPAKQFDFKKDENLKELFKSLPEAIEKDYRLSQGLPLKHWLVFGGIVVVGAACTGLALYLGYKATRFAYTQILGRLINRLFKKQPILVKEPLKNMFSVKNILYPV